MIPRRLKQYAYGLFFAILLVGAFWILEHKKTTTPIGPNTGGEVQFFANESHDNLANVYVDAINQAQHSIMLIVYSLTDYRIIDILNKKARQSVNVTVITDSKTSPYIDSKLGPHVNSIRYFGNSLMHQKILVVDKKYILIGSANMTRESLEMHGNLVMQFESPPMAELLYSRALTMKEGGRNVFYPHTEYMVGNQRMELWLLPDNQDAVRRLEKLIDSAKKSIKIAMFAWTRRDLAWAVVDAHKRGVNVEVAIDQNSGKGTGAKIVQILKDNGIPVYISRGTALLHHKFLYIDGQTLVNGSANWTRAAFTQNEDCFIVLYNLTQKQNAHMEAVWKTIISDAKPAR